MGDSRELVRNIRKFSIGFRERFGMKPSVSTIARHIGSLQHEASLKGGNNVALQVICKCLYQPYQFHDNVYVFLSLFHLLSIS